MRNRFSFLRYLAVMIFFALGLMSKPMLVTLPMVLLLLDYWPLRRLVPGTTVRLVLEKLPLFAMSILFCFVAVWSNDSGRGRGSDRPVFSPVVAVGNRSDFLCQLSRHVLLSRGIGASLSSSGSRFAALEDFWRGPGFGRPHGGGADGEATMSLFACRLVVVRRNAGACGRVSAFRYAWDGHDCRPFYVLAADRVLYRPDMGIV